MSSNETISDKLLRAIDAAIDDGNYKGVVAVADCWRSLGCAWSRLGLTQLEAEVAEEIVAVTADCAAPPDDDRATDEPLKVGDRVRITHQGNSVNAKTGEIGAIVGVCDCSLPYLVHMETCRVYACARDQIERVEPEPEWLKFGQWVKHGTGHSGIIIQIKGTSEEPMLRIAWDDGLTAWTDRDHVIPIEPQS